jgi:type I restriction enzyme M protein
LRKFTEGQGQSAGEFYTPKEVGWLMAHLIDPKPYTTVYDPACGSAGLLIKARLLFEEKNPTHKSQSPRLFGQEAFYEISFNPKLGVPEVSGESIKVAIE